VGGQWLRPDPVGAPLGQWLAGRPLRTARGLHGRGGVVHDCFDRLFTGAERPGPDRDTDPPGGRCRTAHSGQPRDPAIDLHTERPWSCDRRLVRARGSGHGARPTARRLPHRCCLMEVDLPDQCADRRVRARHCRAPRPRVP
jgi:hypothetical protein